MGVVVDGATGHPDGRGDEEPHRHGWTTLVCRPRVVEHPPLLPGPCAPPVLELAGIDFELWNLPAEVYPWLHVHGQQLLEASVWHDPAPHPATTGKVASLTLHAVRLRIFSDNGLGGFPGRDASGRVGTAQLVDGLALAPTVTA